MRYDIECSNHESRFENSECSLAHLFHLRARGSRIVSQCTDSLENFGSPGKKKSLFTENSNNPALWCLKTANERYFCELILLLSG